MRSTLVALALLCFGVASCWADNINIGYVYLQEDSDPGTVTFIIQNATGPAESAPEFPVLDNLDFTNVELTVFCGNAQCETDLGAPLFTFDIGTISAGNFDDSVSFSSADTFSSAFVTADLGITSLSLDNGVGGSNPFTGSSSSALALTPSVGSALVPLDLSTDNTDFDLGILVDPQGTGSSVPEPSTLGLVGIGLSSILVRRRRNSKGLASLPASILRLFI